MIQTLSDRVQRAFELGTFELLRRAWGRISEGVGLWGRSLRARLLVNCEMSDSDLIDCLKADWCSADIFLDYLAERPDSSFLLPHQLSGQSINILRKHYPKQVSKVIDIADAACRNEFILLGHEVNYGNYIDWQIEPLTGWRWPLWYRERLERYLWSGSREADFIFTWELNRHQYFVALGMAYWLTRKSRFVETFIDHVQSWIQSNPLQMGINWLGGQEMSCRLIAWMLAFQFFRKSNLFKKQVGSLFLKSLYQQVDFLSKNLTIFKEVPNNHLFAEATALILAGWVFPEFQAAEGWSKFGLQVLSEQVKRQIHADGVNKEQAIGYHRFVAEFLLAVVAFNRRRALPSLPNIETCLEKMLDYLFYSQTPNGKVPKWGDSVNYYAWRMSWDRDYWDFRPLLSTGAVLFNRSDWKHAIDACYVETFWLLGSKSLTTWKRLNARPPKQLSRGFPDAGVYIIRDSWTSDSDVAFFRCGPFGLGGEGHSAHAHCDLLSVMIWINGQPLLVDSGTYIYHGPWRDVFRLTSAHNTLIIDECEQALPLNEYAWKNVPQAKCLIWNEKRVIGGIHTENNILHQREIYHPCSGMWEINDHIEGEMLHCLKWNFHFSPMLSVKQSTSRKYIVKNQENLCALVVTPKKLSVQLGFSWHSSRYGYKEPNFLLEGNWLGEIPLEGIDFNWKFQQIN